MNIGVVSTLYPSRREPFSGVFVKDELDSLSADGRVNIKLIAPLPNHRAWGEPRYMDAAAGYPVRRPFVFSFSRFFGQKYYPRNLARMLRKHQRFFSDCGVIHAHNAFPEAISAVSAFGEDVPVVVTVHGSDINYFAQKDSLRPMILDALNAADAIIAVSSDLAEKVRHMGISTPVNIVPNGIDTTQFAPGSKKEAARCLGLDPDRPRLLFAGNFVPVKGVPYLLRALPAVQHAIPGMELVLLGARSGSDDGGYASLINELGVQSSVRIQTRVPHERLPLWMRAADVFVLPSEHEGFGLVLAEALACGVPVVATTCGGPEDIVGEGTGLLVPPRDPDALADAIIRVLRKEGIGDGEFCAAYAHRKFSYETVVSGIIAIYERLMMQPHRS